MIELTKKIYNILSHKRKHQLLVLSFFTFVSAVTEMGLAGAVSLMGIAMAAPETLEKMEPVKLLLQQLPMALDTLPSTLRMLMLVLALVLSFAIFKNILSGIIFFQQNKVASLVSWDVTLTLYKKYLSAPYSWHTENNTSDMQTLLNWRNYTSGFCLAMLVVIAQTAIMLLLLLAVLVITPKVAMLVYGTLGVVSYIVYRKSRHSARRVSDEQADLNIDINKTIISSLQGIREVQLYGQQDVFEKKLSSLAPRSAVATALERTFPNIPQWFLESAGIFLLFASVIFMISQNAGVATITGTLTLIAGASWRLLPAMNKVLGAILNLKAFQTPAARVINAVTQTPSGSRSSSPVSFHSTIDLKNICFAYPNETADALHDINITIQKGKLVGLVGLSGSGKSTLVGVLTGMLPPREGTFLVDGKPVAPVPGFLKLGYVPQSTYLMDDSLARNIAFADWGKEYDEKRVLDCCRMAAMDFIDNLPDGIHTILGERGTRLSGGQAQRVAIARALYNNPDFLIFDEATSALDSAGEAAIQKTILNLSKEITIIIVAHRLCTIEDCDTIYWIKSGTVYKHGDSHTVINEYQHYLDTKSNV